MNDEERRRAKDDFGQAVNMTAKELGDWLETDESKSVGEGAGESKGHRSGRWIVDILCTPSGDLEQGDYEHMREVTGYVRRHLAQQPSGDVSRTRWRYSLMNWGHDPLKR
ncbi:uncharacterized protein DUF3140 [Saccharopolyspora erythraea NRRL 2338]|uniref:DNA-binding protein n=2 Tax=Saccharopolyspora erythraea TaxID=1836 RepID=A4FE47_SACEN|nr:DUF3140 domain-containing protein [Saccharopolyspora erythraea]PFG96049.1 uncharacterized protein DUF3140 [Saccharopolyspora erythraea NRRL 2338]QRK92597.1 DUF3140 domain-containing protein [Saccharopolyspora erythraea]CAM02322.1 DNA-binding protein [Saccharopolyspora erythraea NRRL 2338]